MSHLRSIAVTVLAVAAPVAVVQVVFAATPASAPARSTALTCSTSTQPVRVAYGADFRQGPEAAYLAHRARLSHIAEGCRGARVVVRLSDEDTLLGQSVPHTLAAAAAGQATLSLDVGFDPAPRAEDVTRVDLEFLAPHCDGDGRNPVTARSAQRRLVGTLSGDYIVGDEGSDDIAGLGGADCLVGQGGSDRLDGGAGADVMLGGGGNDVMSGGGDHDVLSGGHGNDVLRGDEGDDALFAGIGGGTLDGGPGYDSCVRLGGHVTFRHCEVVVG